MAYRWPKTFADLGFLVKAKTLAQLFAEAGKKITRLQVKKLLGQEEREIDLLAPTIIDLLYQFLTELLFLKDRDGFFANDFDLVINQQQGQFRLRGKIKGGFLPHDPKLILSDIKAITYHQLTLKQTKSGWQAKIIVDV